VAVSALTGDGCAALLRTVAERIDSGEPMGLVLPAEDGEALAWLYRNGRVVERHDRDAGAVQLSVRLDPQARGRFERLFPEVRLAAE
jgi:GTPase